VCELERIAKDAADLDPLVPDEEAMCIVVRGMQVVEVHVERDLSA
jgi:hypothetical protein